LQSVGVAFVSLAEGIDATTPAGKLQMHILGAIAEFERARIAERVKAGLQRARAQGKKLGRPVRELPLAAIQAAEDARISAGDSCQTARLSPEQPPIGGCGGQSRIEKAQTGRQKPQSVIEKPAVSQNLPNSASRNQRFS
jgi:hypothetical protein